MTSGTYVLLASLALNGVLGWAYLGQRDETTAAEGRYRAAAGQASACDDATEDLMEAGAKQKAAGAKAITAARELALTWEQRANAERSRPQAVLGDACASAAQENREWLEKRRAKP